MNLGFSIYTRYDYPIMIIDGIIKNKDDMVYYFPSNLMVYHFRNQETNCKLSLVDEHLHPKLIELKWYSFVEKQVYYLEIDTELLNREQKNKINYDYAIGLAPYGDIAIWEINYGKSKLLSWLPSEAKEYIEEDQKIIDINNALRFYIQTNRRLDSLIIPLRNLFDNYMKQFAYRYLPLFVHWDKDKQSWQQYNEEETIPELDYIEEALFDGTHDKLHDGGLLNYHMAGKPKKLAVKWHIKKSEYTAYFWFEDEEIRAVFDRFYGAHPKTKTDFMIRIDAKQNKYELALYRYGLKEPQVISESAYQILVFKNKFEYYRSENYNQPKGAWIW